MPLAAASRGVAIFGQFSDSFLQNLTHKHVGEKSKTVQLLPAVQSVNFSTRPLYQPA